MYLISSIVTRRTWSLLTQTHVWCLPQQSRTTPISSEFSGRPVAVGSSALCAAREG
jgi:hypothetical protein